MKFSFSGEQEEFRSNLRRFLADRATMGRSRKAPGIGARQSRSSRELESKAIQPYVSASTPMINPMTTLTVTAKGQITLRKDLLKYLGVQAGEKIDVEKLPGGRIVVKAARPNGRISDVFGCLKRPDGPSLTIEEINQIAADSWAGRR
jgi:bifunctional DNA-binding transcriptional regulator/antitoxin component of YhaV-PrlF toxin-antitoxin module